MSIAAPAVAILLRTIGFKEEETSLTPSINSFQTLLDGLACFRSVSCMAAVFTVWKPTGSALFGVDKGAASGPVYSRWAMYSTKKVLPATPVILTTPMGEPAGTVLTV